MMKNLRNEAYQIIVKVLRKNIFSDKLLKKLSQKLKDTEENSEFVYSLVKGVIKRQKNLDYICRKFVDSQKFDKTDIKIKTLLYIGFYQLLYMDGIPEHAAVNETVDLAKKLFGQKIANFVNAIIRAYQREPKIEYPQKINERLAVEYSFPQYIIDAWLAEFGEEETEMLCMYYNDIPQISIRYNSLATNRDKLINYFTKKDVVFSNVEGCSAILKSSNVKQILNDVAFSEGYYSVQDSSAAMVVQLLDPQPEESVLDLFAAPGGKATFIAEKMNNKGEVIANDKIPNKIKKLKQALERLQIDIISTVTSDAFKYGPVAPAYDRVLLDVPCSGWGVFQKKAELRWQKNQDIKKLLKIQADALERGAKFVKTSGFMVYSTCTINKEENENQVNKFLQKHPEFTLTQPNNWIDKQYIENSFLKTIPHKHNMDGAFAAKLHKVREY